MAKTLRFRARMEIRDGNPFVLVSAARVRALKPDWRRPMPVLVRVDGKPEPRPWRINMMPVGDGDFYLYLHGDVRRASQTKVGDLVQVEVEFDAAYRNGPMHPMPSWFRTPLLRNAKASRAWDALIPSRKKEILRYLVVAQIGRSPRAKRGAGASCIVWKEGPLHGPIVVNRNRNPE